MQMKFEVDPPTVELPLIRILEAAEETNPVYDTLVHDLGYDPLAPDDDSVRGRHEEAPSRSDDLSGDIPRLSPRYERPPLDLED